MVLCSALFSTIMQQGGSSPQGSPNPFGPFFLIGAFILIFYFLILRPQQKKGQERKKMIGALTKGDKVLAAGGLIGVIVGMKKDVTVLRVSDNVKVEVATDSISQKLGVE